jgi:hypothetical protein
MRPRENPPRHPKSKVPHVGPKTRKEYHDPRRLLGGSKAEALLMQQVSRNAQRRLLAEAAEIAERTRAFRKRNRTWP